MKQDSIDIIDCGYGNMGSILNMLKKIGVNARLCSNGSDLINAKKVILPGVGSFDRGMTALALNGFDDALVNTVSRYQIPCLSICLGMQLLFNSSEEGDKSGLGIIDGKIQKFPSIGSNNEKVKVPNMGWRTVNVVKENNFIIQADIYNPRFYFCHKYFANPKDSSTVIASSFHGITFPAFVKKDNFYGAQFHPEKSLTFGLELIRKFSEI